MSDIAFSYIIYVVYVLFFSCLVLYMCVFVSFIHQHFASLLIFSCVQMSENILDTGVCLANVITAALCDWSVHPVLLV